MVLLTAGAGCGPEKICRDGEYPARASTNSTGRVCVSDGEEPPAGFERYPAGQEPKNVDDEWDVYWRSHKLDERGVETA